MSGKFNNQLADSQATKVRPVKPENFDFEEYADYAAGLAETCSHFWKEKSGVLVYRRMRVAECFSYGCRDMKQSLELQLGALKKSMLFKADIPNFLEPWYGIGTIASSFGCDYIWAEGNAPAVKPKFSSIDEVLKYEPVDVSKTPIGHHTLNMIEYFMDKTRGKLPVSFTDTQSPLNIISHLYSLDKFFPDIILEPEKVMRLFDIIADLSVQFNLDQYNLIGESLVLPGHGFASSTSWKCLGMSNDNAIMISPEQYSEIANPSIEKICQPWGGSAFHSCGDWSVLIGTLLKITSLKMADGAFSQQTDPGATDQLEAFHQFADSEIVLNARIVGDINTLEEKVCGLWIPGMKLIVVTYCETPEEQEKAYFRIKDICKK